MNSPLDGKVILLIGGTGSFGQKFTEIALKEYNPRIIRVFSRGELLQLQMASKFHDDRLRFFIGDVRDRDRLYRAMQGVNIVIHAAALKQVPQLEYNPAEGIKTNIEGSLNVCDCAIDCGVEKVIGISSDKAVHPVNLYGMTKAVMERLFTQANIYSKGKTTFSCTRYGNVIGSRGSVIPLFLEQKKTGTITVTDERMTRFWITLSQGVHFVINCLSMMRGGEIFVPIIPSTSIMDLVNAIAPGCEPVNIGIRPGEKLHELLISEDEARHAKQIEDCYIIMPEFPFWTEDSYFDMTEGALPENFRYSSETARKLTIDEIKGLIKEVN